MGTSSSRIVKVRMLFLKLNQKCQSTDSKAILQLLSKQSPVFEKTYQCYSKISWSGK